MAVGIAIARGSKHYRLYLYIFTYLFNEEAAAVFARESGAADISGLILIPGRKKVI